MYNQTCPLNHSSNVNAYVNYARILLCTPWKYRRRNYFIISQMLTLVRTLLFSSWSQRIIYIIELPFIHYTNEQHSRNTRLTINRLKDYFTWFQKVAPGIISISAIIVWNCNFKTHSYDNIYFIIWLITLNKKKEQ